MKALSSSGIGVFGFPLRGWCQGAESCYLEVIADAIAGRSRRQSAERAGVCQAEISKRRRKGAEIIYDQFLALLY